MISDERVRRYLNRLGFAMRPETSPLTLRALQWAHLRSVPFENLDIHLGVPIVLDPDRLVDKIIRRCRGGFCFELNGAFGALLETLGFDVTYLEARVYEAGAPGIRFDHLCLRVDLDQPYLVDVGFGSCFDEPLVWVTGPQTDPSGIFEIVPRADRWLDLVQEGDPQYRISTVARTLADFEDSCRHHQTSPESHFTHGVVCTIRTWDGRVTLRDRRLIETHGNQRTEHNLDMDEIATVYSRLFGIELDEKQVAVLQGRKLCAQR